MDGSSKGPPPKPAKRQPRAKREAAPSEAPPDKPPPRPRPEVKGRARPPPAPVPTDIEPAAQPIKKIQAAVGDDSKIEPLDLGRDHEGIPHGWVPSYWKYVTRPNKLERSRRRLLNISAYYRISKIYDIGLMLCLLLLIILVIFAGVYSDILYN